MLDLGFLEDVETILSRAPSGRQTALFSATMPPEIKQARRVAHVRPGDDQGEGRDPDHRHRRAVLRRGRTARSPTRWPRCSRPSTRRRRSSSPAPRSASTGSRAASATRGVRVKSLHGDMSQGTRDGVMISFKGGRERLLVATDVAARGLDISGVTHIVNYDIPNSPDVYVHRIGRTGRVGETGRAITLITPKQRATSTPSRRTRAPRSSPGPEADGAGRVATTPRPGSASRREQRETRRRRHTKPRASSEVPQASCWTPAATGPRARRRDRRHRRRARTSRTRTSATSGCSSAFFVEVPRTG